VQIFVCKAVGQLILNWIRSFSSECYSTSNVISPGL